MSEPFIVYYSRTNTTRNIANEVPRNLGCQSEAIVDEKNRLGVLGYLRCELDVIAKRRVQLMPTRLDPTSAPLVVIGTPVWNASVSAPVRSYLLENAKHLPAVAFFATCGRRGSRRAFRQMEQLCGKAPFATLALTERQIARGEHHALIRRFVNDVQRARRAQDRVAEAERFAAR